MKNNLSSFLIILLLQFSVSAFATDYYSIKSGNAADPGTWNSSRTGNGVSPSNFNDAADNFIVQNNTAVNGNDFSCKGSLIIETGGLLQTGNPGTITRISTVVTINNGAILKLLPNTTLVAGFMLVQGTLENSGGQVRFNSTPSSPVVALNRRLK
jgi:hypothetical protein